MLYEPGLWCPACAGVFRTSKGSKKPACMTKRGCDIEDIMRSPESPRLRAKVFAFIKAESMELFPAYAKVQERILSESGLLDEDAGTIMKMKAVLADYRRFDNERSAKK